MKSLTVISAVALLTFLLNGLTYADTNIVAVLPATNIEDIAHSEIKPDAAATPRRIPISQVGIEKNKETNETVEVSPVTNVEDIAHAKIKPNAATTQQRLSISQVGIEVEKENKETSTPRLSQEKSNLFKKLVANKLSIGFHICSFSLDETSRPSAEEGGPTYIGNLAALSEEDDTYFSLSIEYKFCDYLAFEYFNESVKARTYNTNLSGASDGCVVLDAPVFMLKLTAPVYNNRIRPFFGVGLAFWSCDFDMENWWHLGYSNPDVYKEFGMPSSDRGKIRNMELSLKDTTTMMLAVGVEVSLARNLELEFMVKKIELDPDATFTYEKGAFGVKTGDFTMDYMAYSLGVRYVF